MRAAAFASLLCLFSTFTVAAEGTSTPVLHNTFVNDPVLPPSIPWQGKSEQWLQSSDAQWATPFEQSAYLDSPNYNDTIQWLDELMAHSKVLHKVSLGKSPQGRDIWLYVASAEGATTPAQLHKHRKPSLLVQAGIHAGEIDGKDAGMMLLRDIVLGKKLELLNKINLLFIPILNVDGHERSSQYNRVNQRGPLNMGWRTNANNLNLNRDYSKADTLEIQHLLKAINQWQPELYLDVHVTDGIDYQYDITFGYNLENGYSPAIYQWLHSQYRPQVETALTEQNHTPGPLVFALDKSDISKGMNLWNASPRFSNGYGDARHLPTVLIENHSLKPYKQRVLGTYVLLEQSLSTLATHGAGLKAAIVEDQYAFPERLTLTWQLHTQEQGWDFKGIEYYTEKSAISGAPVVRWTGQPKLYNNLPVIGKTQPNLKVNRPSAYYIPPQWTQVIERLAMHGIRMTALNQTAHKKLQQYRLIDPKFDSKSYEGRLRVKANSEAFFVDAVLPAGTIKVDTQQPLGDLAILLLEPQSADSFLQWGLFNPIFSRTEYIEAYAVEPLAQQMLQSNPELQVQFETQLANPEFAQDPQARLRWFYERSPYFDQAYQIYPIYREQ